MLKFLTYILLFSIPYMALSQEHLTGLISNPVIKSHISEMENPLQYKSRVAIYKSLNLPFKDDFSDIDVYPDANRWVDNEAYINAEYPVYPPNYGVATMDVLDEKGDLYSNAGPFPFIADHLTSYPIRLDSIVSENHKITVADSVYLSFYYQPQGRGDIPLGYDSLVLEFGHYSDSVFSHTDYFWKQASDIIGENDTLFVGDTVFYSGCDFPYYICSETYTYSDSISVPCDSVYALNTVFSHIEYYWEQASVFIGENDTIFVGDTIPTYSGCDFPYFICSEIYTYSDSISVPCDSIYIVNSDWTRVWSAPGDSLETFISDTNYLVYFRKVMIPITDTDWLRNDFQFRFYNYGSLSNINSWQSNTDHWHIDEVYLNIGRTKDDIFTRDISFVEPVQSFVKGYYSIPSWQYTEALQKDSITVFANNNDSINHNCTYKYWVQDEQGDTISGLTYNGFSDILEPYSTQNVYNYQPFVKAPVVYWYTLNGYGDADRRISHVIYDEDSITIGDTIIFNQQFRNYFAYDDGSAERSYGLSRNGGRQVVQFKTLEEDTLRGVQILFNKTLDNNNDRVFHIGVWNDNNGEPGVLRYELGGKHPQFKGTNEFYTYIFKDTIIKLPRGIFYVGIIQTTDDLLNIGFDRNTNSRNKIFYNTGDGWLNSSFEGSLMIRAVVGPALVEPSIPVKSLPAKLEIYPNPPGNSESITIQLPSSCSDPKYRKYLTVRVFDICGKLIYSAEFDEHLDVSSYRNGFYIIDVFDAAYTRHYTTKLLIAK